MSYEDLGMDSLNTLEVVLSRAVKIEKNPQFKKDIEYELKRIKEAVGKQ